MRERESEREVASGERQVRREAAYTHTHTYRSLRSFALLPFSI